MTASTDCEQLGISLSSGIIKFFYKRTEDDAKRSIGQRVHLIRKSNHLTIRAIAKSLGISDGTFRRIEDGVHYPSGQILILLHEVYGVDITWLLYGTHSTHDDILTALQTESEQSKFDIFVRLFSYFASEDALSLVAAYNNCSGIEHFAKWNGDYYVSQTDMPDTGREE